MKLFKKKGEWAGLLIFAKMWKDEKYSYWKNKEKPDKLQNQTFLWSHQRADMLGQTSSLKSRDRPFPSKRDGILQQFYLWQKEDIAAVQMKSSGKGRQQTWTDEEFQQGDEQIRNNQIKIVPTF